MRCTKCGSDNREGRKFCGECGAPLNARCPECGARVETTAKEAEKGKVRCPRGHEFAVMGILGGLEGPRER